MNRDRTSEILAAYRPGEGLEEDPEVRAALALAEKDPLLAAFLQDNLAFDEAFSAKLKEAPVPEDLYGSILARARQEATGKISSTAETSENKVLRFLHPAAFAAAAAIILLLALSFTFWNRPQAPGINQPELQTAGVAVMLSLVFLWKRHLMPCIVAHLGFNTLALVLAWGGIYEMLVNYLILLGTFIPPIGGVIMADYWVHRRGEFPSLDAPQPAFNWAGVLAYVGASAIAYFTNQASWGIVPINGIISAAVIYIVLAKIIPQGTPSPRIGS